MNISRGRRPCLRELKEGRGSTERRGVACQWRNSFWKREKLNAKELLMWALAVLAIGPALLASNYPVIWPAEFQVGSWNWLSTQDPQSPCRFGSQIYLSSPTTIDHSLIMLKWPNLLDWNLKVLIEEQRYQANVNAQSNQPWSTNPVITRSYGQERERGDRTYTLSYQRRLGFSGGSSSRRSGVPIPTSWVKNLKFMRISGVQREQQPREPGYLSVHKGILETLERRVQTRGLGFITWFDSSLMEMFFVLERNYTICPIFQPRIGKRV